jgi:DNA-binding response OmpR family regulator
MMEQVKTQDLKKNLSMVYNNAQRLNHLINETLDLAKIEKGKMEVHLEERPIAIDLIRIFLSFTSLAEMRDIHLEGHVQFSDDKYILCDLDKVEKVMNNLVSNAIKFSENGSIVVMNATLDQNLKIDIQDYGKGIPDHEQEKIFNRFYQASHNRMGNYGGTGIGLAFSKEIAQVLGGSLSVNSKVGEGSRFTFSIPAQMIDQPIIQKDVSWEPEPLPKEAYQPILFHGERPIILIVEDNKEMQQYLKDLLKEDYRCEFAHDGFEALKKIQKSKYHLISSDVMMPNMDGFTLKERINVFPEHKKTPFIFLTARSLEEDKLSGLRLGVDDYITKPFSKDEYLIRINNLLNNYKERLISISEEEPVINTESIDNSILKEAEQIILQNISNTNFSVGELADSLHYSQRQLGRILKQNTGLTPVNFILELRLQKAYRMIKSKNYRSVSEVRYDIGIESASYFARKFKERFGISPSEV